MTPDIMNSNKFKPEKLAHLLESKRLLTADEQYTIVNSKTEPSEKARRIIEALPTKGNEVYTIVKFYLCLVDSRHEVPTHVPLAHTLQCLGMLLQKCDVKYYNYVCTYVYFITSHEALGLSGLQRPILANIDVTGVSPIKG